MSDTSRPGFEDRLRHALVRRAGSVSAPPDDAALSTVAARARVRHARRRWEAATLAVVVVMAVGLSVAVTSGGGAPRQATGHPVIGRHLARTDGVLLLPLSGTVTASSPGSKTARRGFGVSPGSDDDQPAGAASTAPSTTAPSTAAPGVGTPGPDTDSGTGNAPSSGSSSPVTTVPASGPIDVAPSATSSLRRLFAHTSPDGVQVTVFGQPDTGSSPPPTTVVVPSVPSVPATVVPPGTVVPGTVPGAAAGVASGPESGTAVAPGPQFGAGCLTRTQVTLEISDVAAVGTASEPLFSGATGALVDVQIGEIGTAEGAPATWVLAQVGRAATTVEVEFADGSVDRAAVGSTGVVVLGHKGAPADALGNGTVAAIDVLDANGTVLAGYGLGTESSVPSGGTGPGRLPSPGAVQPADPGAATAAVTRAVVTALGCTASPLQRLQVVAGGDPIETLPSFAGSAAVNVERVVFTSATAAVVQYDLGGGMGDESGQASEGSGPLYAAATLTGGSWQLSLASVAPGIQVTPANQVGNVTVAPGGPLFVHSWPGGNAVAVYKALPGSSSASGYGTGEAACLPAGGVVEEVTTPGAVGVLSAASFPNYNAPLIGAAVSTVGAAEGSPATVVGVEVGPQVSSVSVTGSAGTVQESPVNGEAVLVLNGEPTTALSASGSELQVSDSTGTVLASVSLQVDAAAPAGPSTLPSTLPSPGQGPADPQAATQAITNAFTAVFDCSTPPIERVQAIQDGSLVEGALEQLDTGPYEALASSTYIDVNQVVFENATLADVSYTLRFHSDAQLTFPMVGRAVVVAGNWRVSYATVCAAVQLGLGNCQT